MAAALDGAREIGFTVVSLTLSLIAVFIPLLFMTGLVGRMFREFALTLTIAVVVSAIVSLTLTPMMCSRLLKSGVHTEGGRIGRFFKEADNERLQAMLTDQFCDVLGGGCKYSGKSMKDVHTNMKVASADFNALAEELQNALTAANLSSLATAEENAVLRLRAFPAPAPSSPALWRWTRPSSSACHT